MTTGASGPCREGFETISQMQTDTALNNDNQNDQNLYIIKSIAITRLINLTLHQLKLGTYIAVILKSPKIFRTHINLNIIIY